MATARAIFPTAARGAGMYESFYLRTVSPLAPRGAWIRYTVLKRPGLAARGSLWCTVWHADGAPPFQHKLTSEDVRVPPDAWIALGEASFGPQLAVGRCGEASFSLRHSSAEQELRHLAPAFLYRAPLPRTKLTSPAPLASFDGLLELAGRDALALHGWPGMIGHNWGAEHAERWIWLHGMLFEGRPQAWLDVALGRVLIAGRMTPWLANGALSIEGRRYRVGGLRARGTAVAESAGGCTLRLGGEHGLRLDARVRVPPGAAAGWRYGDPDGGGHDVLNCSIAELELDVKLPGGSSVELHTAHGAAYELGMREHDHGVAIAPFTDA